MCVIFLVFTLSVLTLTSASAAETRCYTTFNNWNQCYTRCAPYYSQQEIERGAERQLSVGSTNRAYGAPGSRERLERSCTNALERGVENSVRQSYGCRD